MILVHNVVLGFICAIYCCLCWGSWSNTEKLVTRKEWTPALFYWDYIFGFTLTALLGALTLGVLGGGEHTFFTDFCSTFSWRSVGYAVLGGIIWNCANVFLTAAIAISGMSVAFPIGGGFGWVGGAIYLYLVQEFGGAGFTGTKWLFWIGMAIAVVAMVLCGLAYGKLSGSQSKSPKKGIILALISGVGFMFFYGLVGKSLDPSIFNGGNGTFIPYTGVFWFAVGALVTTPVFNGIVMKHPVDGTEPVTFKDYLTKGDTRSHLIGMLGGFIWMSGMVISFAASGLLNPAVAYALSNASPVVAMIWGVFVWKEFKGAPKGTGSLVFWVFTLFLLALVLVSVANS